jgi:hypothetical protein
MSLTMNSRERILAANDSDQGVSASEAYAKTWPATALKLHQTVVLIQP